ncbi:MAG: hypothetical protein J6Y02_23820 [Pseudobutyrivibrio sp.]|nr:hypothetical protein [Pseudobutyrivibrio sp.]
MSAFTMAVIFVIVAIVAGVVWCIIPPDNKPADISDAETVWIWKDGYVMEVYVENLDLFLGAGWRRYKEGDYVRGGTEND